MVFLRFPETKYPHCFRIFRVFQKCHFGGRRGRFWGPNKFSFFACVSGLGSSRRSPRGSGTRNASKQGVSEQFCVAGPGYIALDPLYRLLVAVHFWRKFFGVSQICFFGSSNFWPNWFWKAKKGLGLQNRGDFENDVFTHFARARTNLWHFWRVFEFTPPSRFGFDSGRCQKSACGCGADAFFEVFRCSFVFFCRQRFCKFVRENFENPLSSFCVLLFSALSSSASVDATLHVCSGAVGP